jgi:hypothetical protein
LLIILKRAIASGVFASIYNKRANFHLRVAEERERKRIEGKKEKKKEERDWKRREERGREEKREEERKRREERGRE